MYQRPGSYAFGAHNPGSNELPVPQIGCQFRSGLFGLTVPLPVAEVLFTRAELSETGCKVGSMNRSLLPRALFQTQREIIAQIPRLTSAVGHIRLTFFKLLDPCFTFD